MYKVPELWAFFISIKSAICPMQQKLTQTMTHTHAHTIIISLASNSLTSQDNSPSVYLFQIWNRRTIYHDIYICTHNCLLSDPTYHTVASCLEWMETAVGRLMLHNTKMQIPKHYKNYACQTFHFVHMNAHMCMHTISITESDYRSFNAHISCLS